MTRQISLWGSQSDGGDEKERQGRGIGPVAHKATAESASKRTANLSSLFEVYSLLYSQSPQKHQESLILHAADTIPSDQLVLLASVVWRVRAFQQQLTGTGPLLFAPLCDGIPRLDECGLCGERLGEDERFRCALCVVSLRLTLGYQTLSSLLFPSCDEQDAREKVGATRTSSQEKEETLPVGEESDDEEAEELECDEPW